MTGEREILIRYRVERARETLTEAKLLADGNLWNGCVSRLYYACFHAVTALLLRHGLSSSKHTGVRSLFHRHFVKTGLVSPDLGDLYSTLFNARNRGDYSDLARFDEVTVRPHISPVAVFITEVEALATSPSDGSEDDKENDDG